MLRYPMPSGMPLPVNNFQYARAYVPDQPYIGVVPPHEALKRATIFPFLLKSYLPELKKAEKGAE